MLSSGALLLVSIAVIGAEDASVEENLLEACEAALGVGECTRESAPSAKKAEVRFEGATVLVVLSTRSERIERRLEFLPFDARAQRGRAAGLLVAALSASIQEEAPALPPPPVDPVVHEDSSEHGKSELPEAKTGRFGWIAIARWAPVETSDGGALGGSVQPYVFFRGSVLGLRAGVDFMTGLGEGIGLTSWGGSFGPVVRFTRESGGLLHPTLGVEFLAVSSNYSLRESGVEESRSAERFGARAQAELGVGASSFRGILGVEGRFLTPEVALLSAGVEVAQAPEFGLGLTFGLDWGLLEF